MFLAEIHLEKTGCPIKAFGPKLSLLVAEMKQIS
jgi:hypothetical protein